MSDKYLLVGDVHATFREIEDCNNLLSLVKEKASKDKATVVFMGDLYDTHTVVDIRVQLMWKDFLNDLKVNGIKCILLKGNHDISPGYSENKACSLLAHTDQAITVLYEPYEENGILFFPFTPNNDQFIEWSKEHAKNHILLCHQTFIGAEYDNGFPAKDGIDLNDVVQSKIISGHIHTSMIIGKLFYIGAPRWRNLSDAKQPERFIYLMNNKMEIIEQYTTSQKCSVTKHYVVKKEIPKIVFDAKDRYHIDIHGTSLFVQEARKEYQGKAKIRIFEEIIKSATLSESDPIEVSVQKWRESYEPKYLAKDIFIEKLKKDGFFAKYLK